MVERKWQLLHDSNLSTSPDDGRSNNSWLERMQHSPQKVLVDSQRIVCLTKPNQITLTHCSLSHKIVFPLPPEHTIHTQIPVTCIKSGFSHTLGTNFIGTMKLTLLTLYTYLPPTS